MQSVVAHLAKGPIAANPSDKAALLPTGYELANIENELWSLKDRRFYNIMDKREVLAEWWPVLTETNYRTGKSEPLELLAQNRMHNIEAIQAISSKSHMTVRRWINDPRFPKPYFIGRSSARKVWSADEVAFYLIAAGIFKPQIETEE